ncbi:hypothetical protein MGG_16439 [Pyricularia oryzae 70-15]|uniref:Uncharacterized protein n=1 Tax=Pyricularia oryzae (strain 70-15 / ATCC MYA-4617 / FGSC 8958) TaxID=242507 RepID=G4MNZ7_PYRO7|nr:uncharacterized protein MGG_16439 [Pyricularia oryzae 70-15]EHA57946.1 hypothetical protein MGG_16439 [Pyricularia oryzae 70-15]KAI7924427.1 hypothetical protein M9X92_003872 [Pyricularia oryzae]KAI7931232.1 hypothetical protein M0657_001186 [Pyricularia oryzae]
MHLDGTSQETITYFTVLAYFEPFRYEKLAARVTAESSRRIIDAMEMGFSVPLCTACTALSCQGMHPEHSRVYKSISWGLAKYTPSLDSTALRRIAQRQQVEAVESFVFHYSILFSNIFGQSVVLP